MAGISLRYLANKFNVASSTVSRALSGDSGVSDDLAERIRVAAAEAGYRPKPLRRKINRTIGLINCGTLSGERESYQSTVVLRVLECVVRHGWHLVLESAERDGPLPRLVAENRVDGVILHGFPSEKLCRRLIELGMPAVSIDDLSSRTGLPCVMPDIGKSTQAAVERLRAMRHKKIALVATPSRFPTVASRIAGFIAGVKLLNLPNEYLIHAGSSSLQQGQFAVAQLMSCPKPPTAIIFTTDQLALGGMIGLFQGGYSIPRDVSIVGHDNTMLSLEPDPSISSVDLNLDDTIEKAFQILRSAISHPGVTLEPEQTNIPTRIIWRGSCGPCREGFGE